MMRLGTLVSLGLLLTGLAACSNTAHEAASSTEPVAVSCPAFGVTEHDHFPPIKGYGTPEAALGGVPDLASHDYVIEHRTDFEAVLVRRVGGDVVSVATARRYGASGWVITEDKTCNDG